MDSTVITTLISTLGTVVVAVITVLVKTSMDNKKAVEHKAKEEAINEVDLEEMIILQDWLEAIRDKYGFDRSSIFQFHNGGKFFQGRSMKKFSMTYEAVAPGYEKTKRAHQNVLCSEYPKWISTMITKKCFANLVAELEPRDKHELEQMGVQQYVTVPIYCLKGALIGFIVGYNMKKIDENVKSKFVPLVEESKLVSGYLA